MDFPHKEPFLLEPVILSWVGGFIDTVGFLGLGGLFMSSIIQNLIVAGSAAPITLTFALLSIGCFILAMALVTYSFTRNSRHSIFYKARWYVAESVLLLLCMAFGSRLDTSGILNEFLLGLTALCGVAAMGIHAAISRLLLRDRIGTATATGNLIQLTIRLTEYIADQEAKVSEGRAVERKLLLSLFGSVVSFVVGIAVAIYSFEQEQFLALILPCALMLFLSYKEYTFAHLNHHRSDMDGVESNRAKTDSTTV
ncbi:MAG: YoaK family protein [Plesiomonas sp.]|uniref:YoaK family protein n=1 Tax=Plesiomonas sp. TaxID=2486279 RepID=UPI003F30D080